MVKNIEVIIRFHSIVEISRLDKLIFSLSVAKRLLRLNVVLQGFSPEDERRVESLLMFHGHSDFVIQNIPNPHGEDLRARLLNAGLNVAICPLVHFVDYDDIVFSSAYERIVDLVNQDGFSSAIYFFRVVRAYSNVINGEDVVTCVDQPWRGSSVADLIQDNFCPLHSYLINLNSIREACMSFDETYSALEDYDFLLRVIAAFTVSFEGISLVIGIYNFRNDGSNSTIIGGAEDSVRQLKWNAGREKISNLKRQLCFEVVG